MNKRLLFILASIAIALLMLAVTMSVAAREPGDPDLSASTLKAEPPLVRYNEVITYTFQLVNLGGEGIGWGIGADVPVGTQLLETDGVSSDGVRIWGDGWVDGQSVVTMTWAVRAVPSESGEVAETVWWWDDWGRVYSQTVTTWVEVAPPQLEGWYGVSAARARVNRDTITYTLTLSNLGDLPLRSHLGADLPWGCALRSIERANFEEPRRIWWDGTINGHDAHIAEWICLPTVTGFINNTAWWWDDTGAVYSQTVQTLVEPWRLYFPLLGR